MDQSEFKMKMAIMGVTGVFTFGTLFGKDHEPHTHSESDPTNYTQLDTKRAGGTTFIAQSSAIDSTISKP